MPPGGPRHNATHCHGPLKFTPCADAPDAKTDTDSAIATNRAFMAFAPSHTKKTGGRAKKNESFIFVPIRKVGREPLTKCQCRNSITSRLGSIGFEGIGDRYLRWFHDIFSLALWEGGG